MKTKILTLMLAGAGVAFAAPQAPAAAVGKIPAWLDITGNGGISELERQAFAQARREAAGSLGRQWDTNGDGVIDDGERAAAVEELKARAASRLSELFLAAAGDDGVLDIDEFTALAPERMPAKVVSLLFGLLDVDKDGFVTLEEFLRAAGPPELPELPELPEDPATPPVTPGKPADLPGPPAR